MHHDRYTRDDIQEQVKELLERFGAQGHGQKMFGMTLVEALMDTIDDVAMDPYEVPDQEPVDDGTEVIVDWSNRSGYRAICNRHGVLPKFWQPHISEADKHDYTVILAWDHMCREHRGSKFVHHGMLINPDKHETLMDELRERHP